MPIKIKDHDKCKEWERRRRDRLNDAFKNLAQLLPHYDPAKIPAKIEILEKSTDFVKELRLSNSRLLSKQAETDEKCKLIKELQDEVNKLILRVKQLTVLLKKAKITIPTGPEIKSLGVKRHKWSGKLKAEDVENSVIPNGNSIPSEKISSPEKVNGSAISQPSESDTPPVITNPASQSSNGIKTNSTAISTSVASIIVPLKETNITQANTCANTIAKTSASELRSTTKTTVITTTSCQTPSTATIVTSIIAPPSIQTSPTKVITTSEPIFTTATTNPLQLPLQTFIITPCPITGTAQATALTSQNSQILTRIANILPASILPRPLESIALQKLPIKSLLKPIPKVIKRRKRKSKKNELPVEAPTKGKQNALPDKAQNETENQTEKENDSSSKKTEMTTLSDDPKDKPGNDESTPALVTIAVTPEVRRGDNDDKEDHIEGHVLQNDKQGASECNSSGGSITPVSNQLGPVADKEVETTQSNKAIDISKADSNIPEKEGHCSENPPSNADEPSPENIPVLRIIEAPSEESMPSKDILSTIVVEKFKDKDTASLQKVDKNTEDPSHLLENPVDTEGEKGQSDMMQVDEVVIPSTEQAIHAEDNASVLELDASEEKTDKQRQIPEVELTPLKNAKKLAEIDKATLPTQQEKMDVIEHEIVLEQTTDNLLNQNIPVEKRNIAASTVEKTPTTDISKSGTTCDNPLPDTTVEPANKQVCKDSQPTPLLEALTTAQSTDVQLTNADIQIGTPKSIRAGPESLVPLDHLPEATPSSSSEAPVLTSLDKEKEDSGTPAKSDRKSLHKDLMDTSESVSTTDKISECIARSIDLIDANDSELMELGEHWEDPSTSPKSISPTQIFLNIFPLLPRDSSGTEPQQQPTPVQQIPPTSTSQTYKNPFLPSSNSRSSFFIDSMLPDDNAVSNTNSTAVVSESNNEPHTSCATSHSPFLPLTPPQYSSSSSQQVSSPFSLSNNYYWTPPAASSSGNVEPTTTEHRSSSSSIAYSLHESPRVSSGIVSSSSSVITTTAPSSTLTTICPTKSSTTKVSAAVSSTSIPTTSVHTVYTSKSSSSKRSKPSTAAAGSSDNGKLAFTFDTNLPTFSKSKSTVTSTVSKATALPTISATWTLPVPVPTPTQPSTFHQHHSSSLSLNQPTSEATVPPSLANPDSSSQVPHHSCSLLDSLNPMDAAFFRPLMNALENHDFRNLEFLGSNALPPPPPPLPPLIPPPPTKPLYSSQSVQNPVTNANFHDHTTTSIQGSFMHHHHHHHQPLPIFGSNIQQLSGVDNANPPQSKNPSNVKHQDAVQIQQHHSSSIPQTHRATTSKAHIPPANSAKASAATDKTSRTSGRQKSESTKKSRTGKSSRTQPYIIPSSSSSGGATVDSSSSSAKRYDQSGTQKPSHTYPFHTIQSHINPSPTKSTGTHSNRSHGFQMDNLHSSSHFETPEVQHFQKYSESATASLSSHTERTLATKPSESSKSHKAKEEKSLSSLSSNVAKQSKVSRAGPTLHPPCLPEPQSQNVNIGILNNNAPLSTQATSVKNNMGTATASASSHAAAARPNNTQTQHESLKPIQNTQSSGNAFQQMHYTSVEPFQLFPEFSVGGNTRQFGTTHTHSHHYHHSEPSSQGSLQQSQNSAPAANAFHAQRSHPYYFADIATSFDSFASVPVQPQPQLHLSHHQQVQNSSSKQSSVSNSNSNCSQGHYQAPDNSNAKFGYGSNSSNVPQSQPLQPAHIFNQEGFQQLHVQQQQQQKISRPTHDTPHSCAQQVSLQQQTPSVSTHHGTSQRHHQPTYQQNIPPPQSQNSHSTVATTSTTSATTTVATSSAKGKQQQQGGAPTSFHVSATSTHHHHHHQQHHHTNNQHHQQQVQLQNTHNQQQQNVPQTHLPASRPSSSKTVNWMTDTGYRSTSSSSTPKQQRHNTSGTASTNNPFSVSKLVGTSSVSAPSKSHQPSNNPTDISSNVRGQSQQQTPSSQNINPVSTSRNQKSAKNANAGASSNSISNTSTTNQSHNQSNYCAEALIRKNPPPVPPPIDWTNEFNLAPSTNQGTSGTGYSVSHHHSNPHTLHHHHHHTAPPEHFPNYGNMSTQSYHYPTASGGGESHASSVSSNTSHFTHFDHVQPQYQATHHHNHHHNQSHGQAAMSSNTYSTTPQGQRHHNPQSHNSQSTGASQIHYSHQHNYPHHSNHQHHNQGSTSSVTNFNLSTIFPEINDKRNNSGLGGQGRTTSGNNATDTTRGSGSGNLNPACSYHHPNFGSSAGGSGSIH